MLTEIIVFVLCVALTWLVFGGSEPSKDELARGMEDAELADHIRAGDDMAAQCKVEQVRRAALMARLSQ